MPKMSFTIDKDTQFPALKEKNVTWGGGHKDDGTIESIKSQKSTHTKRSTTDVTKVSLALTMATFESKITEILNQYREDDQQQ